MSQPDQLDVVTNVKRSLWSAPRPVAQATGRGDLDWNCI